MFSFYLFNVWHEVLRIFSKKNMKAVEPTWLNAFLFNLWKHYKKKHKHSPAQQEGYMCFERSKRLDHLKFNSEKKFSSAFFQKKKVAGRKFENYKKKKRKSMSAKFEVLPSHGGRSSRNPSFKRTKKTTWNHLNWFLSTEFFRKESVASLNLEVHDCTFVNIKKNLTTLAFWRRCISADTLYL